MSKLQNIMNLLNEMYISEMDMLVKPDISNFVGMMHLGIGFSKKNIGRISVGSHSFDINSYRVLMNLYNPSYRAVDIYEEEFQIVPASLDFTFSTGLSTKNNFTSDDVINGKLRPQTNTGVSLTFNVSDFEKINQFVFFLQKAMRLKAKDMDSRQEFKLFDSGNFIQKPCLFSLVFDEKTEQYLFFIDNRKTLFSTSDIPLATMTQKELLFFIDKIKDYARLLDAVVQHNSPYNGYEDDEGYVPRDEEETQVDASEPEDKYAIYDRH